MDLLPSSPQGRLQLQLQTEAALLNLPGGAPNSAAFTGRALPYAVNENYGYGSHPQQRRALSQTTLAPPPMHRSMSNHSEPTMPAHIRRPQVPASDGRRVSHERLAINPLPRVHEDPALPDVGMTPDAFLSTYLSSTGTDLSHQDMFSNDTLSAPPSMVSASSFAEASHPMTRENSYVHASPRVDMERLASYTSHAAGPAFGQGALEFPQLGSSWKGADINSTLFAIGDSFSFSGSQPYEAPENQTSLSPTFALMERGESTASMMSTRSTASCVERRAKEARERVLQASKTTSIAPMPQVLPRNMANHLAVYGRRTTQQKNRTRQRPRPAKLQCDHCSEHPEGFRGDHELRRHVKARHADVVVKFICRDPAEVGIKTDLQVIYPLSRCKACKSNKMYGAYYNAAAHLRRTHFRIKPTRGRAGMGERRGGKGGGDWPPMAELKAWFEEILVRSEGSDSVVTGDDPPDDESLSLDADEVVHGSSTHMSGNANPGDMYGAFGDHDFGPNDMSGGYMDHSGHAADAGFAMMPEFDESDIDLTASSQDSVTSSAFQSMDNFSLDELWMIPGMNQSDESLLAP
ncbi:key lime pathogenicity [Trichoderma arundinaceum]|uniref:Key lime pathogenicity n=1 Tax=Trichoderma arundinaceum TaxID=490622 RepID=A0A395NKW8_TRIAR|nr:key lime pathogenicity [Trichoderma arundinaceum]